MRNGMRETWVWKGDLPKMEETGADLSPAHFRDARYEIVRRDNAWHLPKGWYRNGGWAVLFNDRGYPMILMNVGTRAVSLASRTARNERYRAEHCEAVGSETADERARRELANLLSLASKGAANEIEAESALESYEWLLGRIK